MGLKNEIIAPRNANTLPWIASGTSVTYQTCKGIVKNDSINTVLKSEIIKIKNEIYLLSNIVLNPNNDNNKVEYIIIV